MSAGQSLSEPCLCVEWLPLCISIGITTVHNGAISIATVLHSATDLDSVLRMFINIPSRKTRKGARLNILQVALNLLLG